MSHKHTCLEYNIVTRLVYLLVPIMNFVVCTVDCDGEIVRMRNVEKNLEDELPWEP